MPLAPELFTATSADVQMTIVETAAPTDDGDASSAVDTTNRMSVPPANGETADESAISASQYPLEGLNDTTNDAMDVDSQAPEDGKVQGKKSTKPRKRQDPESEPRSTIHSSKNEGQHTDKRYLCYMCNKLFTRRRSVRDHLAKIHSVKTWEPSRSLEVTVDPISGEPTEPIEDIIKRGPPPPPEKTAKPKKEKPPKTEDSKGAEERPLAQADPPGPAPAGDAEFDLGEFPLGSPRIESPARSTAEDQIQPPPSDDRKPASKQDAVEGSTQSLLSPTPPTQIIGKKRPAPEANKPLPTAATKKGIAKPKPKKPRLTENDSVSDRGSPFRSPSATPLSARPPTSKLKKQVSTTSSPASSRAASVDRASPSPSVADTPGSSNDDGEVFCICRKGDNHTWMIACDGSCDEWYHGKCVNIREKDGDLIDKYICPRCTRSDLQTTWKRMCRRYGCRKPARVFQDPPSKYCSKECGRMFFVELIGRGDPYIETLNHGQFVTDTKRPKKMRKKRKMPAKSHNESPHKPLAATHGDAVENSDSRLATPAYSEDEKSEYETDSSADEDELPNRGGPLRAGEIKAIAETCTSLEQWVGLGRKPETPPPDSEESKATLHLDDFEKRKLDEIETQKAENTTRLAVLDAKEKFLEAAKARSSGITEEVKKSFPKSKDLCGFDPRLAWNDGIFKEWYFNKGGKEILDAATPRIGPPDNDFAVNSNGDKLINGVDDESDGDAEGGRPNRKGGICVRSKCSRHRQWAKAQLAEIRFEQDVVKRNVWKTEELERGIKERGTMRAWDRE